MRVEMLFVVINGSVILCFLYAAQFLVKILNPPTSLYGNILKLLKEKYDICNLKLVQTC
jgi:hypothetical protein